MKKFFLLSVLILVAFAPAAIAQHYRYADTTYYRYYQFDPEEWIRADSAHNFLWAEGYGDDGLIGIFEKLQYNYTDNPQGVEVAGIAICSHQIPINDDIHLYAYLYEADEDTFVLMDTVRFDPWHSPDLPEHLLVNVGNLYQVGDCPDNCMRGWLPRIWHEFYFEKPIRVFDSFYVGVDIGDYFFSNEERLVDPLLLIDHYQSVPGYADTCTFPPILWKKCLRYHYPSCPFLGPPLNEWRYDEQTEFFMLVLPIFMDIDSTADLPPCPNVTNLRIYRQFGDEVTLKWNANGGTMWEVSRGPLGSAPGEGILDTVTSPQWRTADSSFADTTSIAYVRTICTQYDTLRYSDWSRGVSWHGSRVGMYELDAPQTLSAVPNPAHDRVSLVGLPEGESQVMIYNSQGTLVLSTTATASDNVVSLSTLPQGAYVIRVITPNDNVAIKIVKSAGN